MEAIIEKRVEALENSMENVGKYIDEVTKWLSDHMNKAIDGTSWGDYLTGWLSAEKSVPARKTRKSFTTA